MTAQVKVKNLLIGAGAPVSIQSMTNTKTQDVQATQDQIDQLAAAGADLVRISVYDQACAQAVKQLHSPVPLCADIHFDYKLAIAAMENGIDKLRINPGNLSDPGKVGMLADCAKAHRVPIRIGVNGGSLDKALLAQYGATAQAMVHSAFGHIALLEKHGFFDIVVSLKASDVRRTIEANRLFAKQSDYPLHLGVTEAGIREDAVLQSAMGIGALLYDGIGDTIRVSVTGEPVQEVQIAKDILKALGLRQGLKVVSCPTCGRCSVDTESIVRKIKETVHPDLQLHIAVMGCVVNGIGEGKDADIGIAFAPQGAVIFAHGQIRKRVPLQSAISELLDEIKVLGG